MLHGKTRSRTVRLGLSAVAVAAALATASPVHAAPGHAATPGPSVDLQAPDHVPVLVRGVQTAKSIVVADADFVSDGKLTVDVAELAGIVDVGSPDGCTTADTKITCPITPAPDHYMRQEFNFTFRATNAKAGTTAGVTYTVTATGVTAVTRHATVEVLDDADLAVTSGGTNGGHLKPGDRVRTPISFTNIGSKEAKGFTVRIGWADAFAPARYDNCAYSRREEGGSLPQLATCTFADTVAPGSEYKIVDEQGDGVAATVKPGSYGESDVDYDVQVGAPAQKATGNGGHRLRLAPVNSIKANDFNPANNYARIRYLVDNTYDYALLGATASGKVGDVVHVNPGIQSNGPSSPNPVVVEPGTLKFWWVKFLFTLPEGTEATAVPEDCVAIVVNGKPNGPYTWHPGKAEPGGTVYRCWAFNLGVGQTRRYDIALKITKVVPDATGTVSFHEPYGYDSSIEDPYTEPQDPPVDRNTGNDKATVVINPTGGGAGGGSGLPITGGQTGLIAASGLVLLVVGAALYLLARRRRVVR
jgi:LPXTG-motif cell wall-anchored protein